MHKFLLSCVWGLLLTTYAVLIHLIPANLPGPIEHLNVHPEGSYRCERGVTLDHLTQKTDAFELHAQIMN